MSPFAVLSAVGAFQQLRASINGWAHRISLASAFGVAAFVFVLIALIFGAVALFLALSDAIPPVAAAAVVALIFLLLAAVAGLLARHAVRRGRGGTGLPVPAPLPLVGQTPMTSAASALGGIDPKMLLALGAGLVGGLIATQLRLRATESESRKSEG